MRFRSFSPVTRRTFLGRTAQGLGAVALGSLLGLDRTSNAATRGALARLPLPQKAKRVIWLSMAGGPSHLETFDPKPKLAEMHGQPMPESLTKGQQLAQLQGKPLLCFAPQHPFAKFGAAGTEICELFPHIGSVLDEICLIRSMTTDAINHDPAHMFMNTGSQIAGRPSMGAWVTYGIGSESTDLPGFVVLNGGQIPSGGLDCFGSGFLPASFQGSLLNANGAALANITPAENPQARQTTKQRLVERLNRLSLQQAGANDALESAIANAELAARMQVAIPSLMDLSGESESTCRLYGLESEYVHTRTYARQCMLARRMVERGVRFIELTIPMVDGYNRWDAHGNLRKNHGDNARAVDQPIAGLLIDLKQRGLTLAQHLATGDGLLGFLGGIAQGVSRHA